MAANVEIVINAEDRASGVFSGLTVTLGDVLGIAGRVADGLSGVFGKIIGESSQAADGQAQLNAVLTSTGGVAGVSASQVNALASKYQDLTKFTDDQVLSAENMLLTFTNIGSKVFPDATKTALDMAQALHMSSDQAAIMEGKALSSAQGVSALRRVGVQFTDAQETMIKRMFETGDAAGAQQAVLRELQNEFGGSAEAAGRTFSGALAILSHHFDDLAQRAGDQVVPALQHLIQTISTPQIMDALGAIADALGGILGSAITWVADTAIPALIGAWETIAPAVEAAGAQIMDAAGVLIDLGQAAVDWGYNVAAQFASGIAEGVGEVESALQSIASVVTGWLQPGSPPRLLPNLDKWGAGAASAYLEGWTQGDFSAFTGFADQIKTVLMGMADSGGMSKGQALTDLIGSQDAWAAIISSMQQTGTVGEDLFAKLRAAAGPAGEQAEKLARAYLAAEQAAKQVDAAQHALDDSTHKVKSAEEALRDAKASGDAQRIAAAQARLDAARRDQDHAKARLDAAKEAEKRADAEVEQLKSIIAFQKQRNDLLKEQYDLQHKSGGGGGGGGGAGFDAAKAEEEATFATKSHAEQVEILKDRLSHLTPGTKEYFDTLKQLNGAQAAAQKDSEDLAKAQFDAALAGKSHAERVELLKDRLSHLTPGTKEYFDTLKQLNSETAAAEKATAGHARAHHGAAGGAHANAAAHRALIPAMQEATRQTHSLGDVFQGLHGRVTAISGPIKAFASELVTAFSTGNFAPIFASFGRLAERAGNWIFNAIPKVLDGLATFEQHVIDWIMTAVPKVGAAFGEYGVKAVSWIASKMPALADNLGLFFNRMVNWVVDSLPKWGSELGKLALKLQQWVVDALPGLGTNLGSAAGKILGWVIQTAADVVPKLLVLAGKFISWVVTDVLPALPGVLASIGEAIFNFITSLASEVTPRLAEVGKRFLNWITSDVLPKLPGLLDSIKKLFNDAVQWIVDQWNALPGRVAGVGGAIVEAIKSGFERAWASFIASAQQKLQEFRDKLPFSEPRDSSSPLFGLGRSGAAIVEMLQGGINTAPALTPPPLAPIRPAFAPALAGPAALRAAPVGAQAGGGQTIINLNFAQRGPALSRRDAQEMLNEALRAAGGRADTLIRMNGLP